MKSGLIIINRELHSGKRRCENAKCGVVLEVGQPAYSMRGINRAHWRCLKCAIEIGLVDRIRVRKKPIEIVAELCTKRQIIHTLEGDMVANVGDWIITGVNGERYPCKSDIFAKTYDIIGGL